MSKKIIASFVALAFASPSYSAENINLDDVVVTASRIEEPLSATLRDISVIDSEQIERSGQSTLLEILQTQPGIEITSNGGAGKTSGIFIRGTNTNHVLVLIDGVRVISATAGTTTFENLPVALIDKIEILRGPAASLYGQDAIGGVIQIFTKKGSGSPKFYAGIGYGTYDTKTAEAGVHGGINNTNFAFGVSSLDSDGFSSYKTNDNNYDDNDGYRNLSVSGSVSHKVLQDHELGLHFLHSKGKTSFDNRFNEFAFDPTFSDNAEITQHSYSIYSKNKFTSNWLSTLKVGEGYDEQVTYAALGFSTPVSRSVFRTKQHQWSWQNDVELPLGTLTLAYDRLEERVKSTSTFDKTGRNNDGYYASYLVKLGNHSAQANYRSDHNSSFGTNDTHGLAYGYRFNDNWRTNISYGTAFKAPTFNDLYTPFTDFGGGFSYQGNTNLRPETSRNKELSIIYNNDASYLSATYYHNDIRNLILGSQGIAADTAINLGSVTIKGLTLAGNQTIRNWYLGGSIDIQSPRNNETDNLLIRRANKYAKANLSYSLGDWRFGAETVTSSKRYNDGENNIPMAGYTVFNLTTDYQINTDLKVQARLNNVFDENYALAFDGNPNTTGFAYDTSGSNLFVNLRWAPK
jgi:vitamin B12 transporter